MKTDNISPNDKVAEIAYKLEGDTLQKLIERAFAIHLKTGGYPSDKGEHEDEG